MSSTLTDLTAATTWSGTDLFYALVGGNSRKIAASKFLVGEAAAVLAQVDSTTAQTFRVYRTFTDSSNYERLALTSGSGYFEIVAETAGTGTDNIDIKLTPAGSLGGLIGTWATTSNGLVNAWEYYLRTSGTAGGGLGLQQAFFLESSTGADKLAGTFEFAWTDATNGAEVSYIGFQVKRNGADIYGFIVGGTMSATQTALQIYDVDNAATERVSVGAADSGGSGFKLLRIPN